MKYLKKYEYASYLNLHGDDNYDIEEVKRDKNHDYEYCDGVLYELSGKDDRIVYIEEVENTEGNTFYEDQIERYIEYIEDGGILQTFPVDSSKKADNLEDMLSYIDDEKDGFDIVYTLFKGNPWDNLKTNDKMYDLYMARGGYWNITSEPTNYGFINNIYPFVDLKDIRTIKDLKDVYYDYSDEEPDKDDENYEEWEERMNNYDEDILSGLIDIMKYFEDEEEYSLKDFNHRFEALKRMGKDKIYIEVM